MRLDPATLAALADWTERQEKARREYEDMPIATGKVSMTTQECLACGLPTYSKTGVHRRCRA